MFKKFSEFAKYLKENSSVFINDKLKKVIQDFTFILISSDDDLSNYFEEDQLIKQNIQNSKIIMIDKNELLNEIAKEEFIILCFEKTLIILKQSMIFSVYTLLSNNSNLQVCFLKNTKEIFTEQIQNQLYEYDEIFKEEIQNINTQFRFKRKNNDFQFWPFISPCISGYLIKKSYLKINYNRIQSFHEFENNPFSLENLNKEDFIELRNLGFGSLFIVILIYHIDRGELFALKKPNSNDKDISKSIEREKSNYEQIHHPFVPKFFGTNQNDNSIIIEFINGQTLEECKFDKYDNSDIIIIIYKLLFIVEFIHDKNKLIRDLKPKNLMMSGINDIVMIDFDRVIKKSAKTYSLDIYNIYEAPEVETKALYSDKSDIYSLGKVIEFILDKTNVNIEISVIKDIINQCIREKEDQRPSIKKIIEFFLTNFRNINNAIYYFSLESYQNHPEAQYNLGVIYSTGEYVKRDINKAIYYYSLASNQNHPEAQFRLGIIYYSNLYCKQDIHKGKQYIMLSSYYECRKANFAHGFLLHKEKKIMEAIHYYKEASSFNIQFAKNNLGIIYKHGFGDEIPKRIGDSIVYFEEAIQQKNDILSMYNLAHIHIYEENIKRDTDKSIELLIKSSNKFNHSFNLLCIVLIKRFEFNIGKIQNEINKRIEKTNELYAKISKTIKLLINQGKSLFLYVDYLYEIYRNKDFLYDVLLNCICSSDLLKENTTKNPNLKDISEDFYEGFGYDIINRDSKS